jgi:hypothetical protein
MTRHFCFFLCYDGLCCLPCSYSELITKLWLLLTVGLLGRGTARRKAATYTGEHKHKKRKRTFMSLVGFEPAIPVLGRAKTFRGLGRAVIVIGD